MHATFTDEKGPARFARSGARLRRLCLSRMAIHRAAKLDLSRVHSAADVSLRLGFRPAIMRPPSASVRSARTIESARLYFSSPPPRHHPRLRVSETKVDIPEQTLSVIRACLSARRERERALPRFASSFGSRRALRAAV